MGAVRQALPVPQRDQLFDWRTIWGLSLIHI